jgi:hypothetical protein
VKICSAVPDLLLKDGQTNIANLIDAFFNFFANASKIFQTKIIDVQEVNTAYLLAL